MKKKNEQRRSGLMAWSGTGHLLLRLLLLTAVLLLAAGIRAEDVSAGAVFLGAEMPCENCIYASSGKLFYVAARSVEDRYYPDYYVYETDLSGHKKQIALIEGSKQYANYSFYYSKNKLYFAERGNGYSGDGDDVTVSYIDLGSGSMHTLFTTFLKEDTACCVGADDKGQIYLGTAFEKRILVFDRSGRELARSKEDVAPLEFLGFDASNGNIYYRGETNWVYWGYDHSMSSLKAARFTGSSVITSEKGITTFYQNWYFTHYGCAEMITDRYLADLSTFGGDVLYILDSSKISPANVTDTSTTISLIDNGVSVSAVNLKNASAVTKLAVQTADSDYTDDVDVTSAGTRCLYDSATGLLLVHTDEKTITAYRFSDGKKIGTIATERPVYKLLSAGGKLAVWEKDGSSSYLETFSLKMPTKISLTGAKTLKVGGHGSLSVTQNSVIVSDYRISSSDTGVLTVDEEGVMAAWKKGTVTLTVRNVLGLEAQLKVTVSDPASYLEGSSKTFDGEKTENDNAQNYHTYGKVVNSYLAEAPSKQLMRVEYLSSGKIRVEYLNKSGKVVSQKTIKRELKYFGGFFAGGNAYYLVFGQPNKEESAKKEVVRVVKYSRRWERLKACSISDINTVYPFDAGSLRMTETAGKLYIHTCHEMYTSDDGLNHQANMTFVINEGNMKLEDSWSDVMNLSRGYVSHSFNQFIRTDDRYVYRADHGDAYPRGIALTAVPVGGKVSNPTKYATVMEIEGSTGVNYTGASIGGMELSGRYVLIAGNLEKPQGSGIRNVFLTATDKETFSTKTLDLTSYTKTQGITCGTPQLVKVDPYHFLLMWMEHNDKKDTDTCALVQISASGRRASKTYKKQIRLSDCQPTVGSDGIVSWYISDGKETKLFRINPYYPDSIAEEASVIRLKKKAVVTEDEVLKLEPVFQKGRVSAEVTWTTSDKKVASVDRKEKVTAKKKGTAVITATTDNGLTASCKVTVKEPVAPQTVKLSDAKSASSRQAAEKSILSTKKTQSPKAAQYSILKLKAAKTGKASVTLKWSKVKGASGYVVYGAKAGDKFKKLAELSASKTVWTHSKLEKGTYYNYVVLASGLFEKSEKALSVSNTIVIATKGGKAGNYLSAKIKNISGGRIELKKGKARTLKVEVRKPGKTTVRKFLPLAYESTDPSVASVSAKGKIKAVGKGACYVYVFAQNGVSDRVKVRVRQ